MSKSKPLAANKEAFEYNACLVCPVVPKSLKDEALRSNSEDEVDLDGAKKQHAEYLQALHKIDNLQISEIEPNEALPDCVFVEDCAVAVGGMALITRPAEPSRQKEVHGIVI